MMIGSYTSFTYLVMLGKPKSISFSCYPLEKKISICPSLTLECVHHVFKSVFFLKFCHFFRAKLVQKVKNYVFHLNYYETEKIKKTKLVWHQILHYVTHLFQNLTNFDRDITKSRISSFSTFSNFCPIVF